MNPRRNRTAIVRDGWLRAANILLCCFFVGGAQLIRLWQRLPLNQRNERGILTFYRWLEQHRPELLDRNGGDPYRS